MVKVLIFAGGTGRRMNARTRPKQFLMMHGRPIILYTLEKFERHPDIGEIVIVCLEGWIDRLWDYIHQYMLKKVTIIVPGGPTGHDSIYNGLVAMEQTTDPRDIVLIHDGVRPLITPELITTNIQAVKNYGNAITAEAVRAAAGFAAAAAACVTTRPGALEIMPARETVESFLKEIAREKEES